MNRVLSSDRNGILKTQFNNLLSEAFTDTYFSSFEDPLLNKMLHKQSPKQLNLVKMIKPAKNKTKTTAEKAVQAGGAK